MNLKNRIKKNTEFKEIIENKKHLKLKSCTIYYKQSELNINRFGISISKKVGNAVNRNYNKRRVRAVLREFDDNNYLNKFNLIIIIKPLINEMTYIDIKNEISEALISISARNINE